MTSLIREDIRIHRVFPIRKPIRVTISVDKATGVVTISFSDNEWIKFFRFARNYIGSRMGWGPTTTFRLSEFGPEEIKLIVQIADPQPPVHEPDETAEQ